MVALLASGMFVALAPTLGRRLAPAVAVRTLVPACLLVAGSSTTVLAVVAFTRIGQFSEVAEWGPWSTATLRASDPVPATLSTASGILLVLTGLGALFVIGRRVRALVDVHRGCGRLGAPGSLVVLDLKHPDAFTTPGLTGRVVVTTGLLRALDGDERRALLAHETSHLVHRHALWVLAADLAGGLNPFLRPTAAAVRHATERWADEDAAMAVTDRTLVARTVARAALLRQRAGPRPAPAPAATGGHVPRRVQALLAPRQRSRPAALVLLVALVATAVLASVAVEAQGDALFDTAARTLQGTED